jgi:putative MFS transporter
MVLLLVGNSGVISMLSPYAAEVYPTHLRASGSGFAAGVSKLGGIVAPPLAARLLGITPGFFLVGLAMSGAVAISALMLTIVGVETRDRGLEDLAGASSLAHR